jgi:hypothetical protein
MAQQMNMQDLEHKAALYYGDGLLDIAIGLALLAAGIMIMADLAALTGVFAVLAFVTMMSLKKVVTAPRMHTIAIDVAAEQRVQRGRLIIALLAGVLLFLGVLAFVIAEALPAGITGWRWEVWAVISGVILVGLLGLAAWVASARRFTAYIGLAIIAGSLGFAFQIDFPLIIFVIGAGILISGIVILVQFMRNRSALAR